MKLLEEIQKFNSIHDAVKQMIMDLFNEDLDEETIDEIISELGVSDLLGLDNAYQNKDVEAVKKIIGPLPQLEYSMGRQATSQAANRTQPARVEKEPKSQNTSAPKPTTQVSRNYNQGVKNNTQEPEDSDMEVVDTNTQQDKMNETQGEQWNSDEILRALAAGLEDIAYEDPQAASGMQRLIDRINQSYPDSVSIMDIEEILREPDMREVKRDDIMYALGAAGIVDMIEARSDNVISMHERLSRRGR